jgi:hypothetical protein
MRADSACYRPRSAARFSVMVRTDPKIAAPVAAVG